MAKRELIDRNDLESTTIVTDDFSGNEMLDVVLMEDVKEAPVITEQEIVKPYLDKIRAEIYNAIEFERKWLCDAGHTSKDIDIALNAIKSKVKDVLEKGAESEGEE